MVSRTRLKSVLTGLALYAMAAALIGYFGVNAYTGKYGLNAQQELDQEVVALTSELARLKRERAQGEQRVSLLRSDRVDPDMLDERARYQLDYANPRDLVRINTPNKTFIARCYAGMTIFSAAVPLISKTFEINFENVALVAVRHMEFRKPSRNPFMAV